MNALPDIPIWVAAMVGALMLTSAAVALIGSFGLLRLASFYERVHAPTLGTTVGASCMALASAIYFSAAEGGLALHHLLIVAVITVTTPISLVTLVHAAASRVSDEPVEGAIPPGAE